MPVSFISGAAIVLTIAAAVVVDVDSFSHNRTTSSVATEEFISRETITSRESSDINAINFDGIDLESNETTSAEEIVQGTPHEIPSNISRDSVEVLSREVFENVTSHESLEVTNSRESPEVDLSREVFGNATSHESLEVTNSSESSEVYHLGRAIQEGILLIREVFDNVTSHESLEVTNSSEIPDVDLSHEIQERIILRNDVFGNVTSPESLQATDSSNSSKVHRIFLRNEIFGNATSHESLELTNSSEIPAVDLSREIQGRILLSNDVFGNGTSHKSLGLTNSSKSSKVYLAREIQDRILLSHEVFGNATSHESLEVTNSSESSEVYHLGREIQEGILLGRENATSHGSLEGTNSSDSSEVYLGRKKAILLRSEIFGNTTSHESLELTNSSGSSEAYLGQEIQERISHEVFDNTTSHESLELTNSSESPEVILSGNETYHLAGHGRESLEMSHDVNSTEIFDRSNELRGILSRKRRSWNSGESRGRSDESRQKSDESRDSRSKESPERSHETINSRESLESDERFPYRDPSEVFYNGQPSSSEDDDYRNYVVDENDVATTEGIQLEDLTVLDLDCSKTTDTRVRRPGYIIGIRADKRNDFASIDEIKCHTSDDDDDDDFLLSHESGEDDDDFYELNPRAKEVIALDPRKPSYKTSTCPIGYLLTGYSSPTWYDSEERRPPPVSANCLQLSRGEVDYGRCLSFSTEDHQNGGYSDPYLKWKVECPFRHAAVGIKFDGLRVRSLRCCKLQPSSNRTVSAKERFPVRSPPEVGIDSSASDEIHAVQPFDEDDYRNYVVSAGEFENSKVVTSLDCSKTPNGRAGKPGYIIGIRANKTRKFSTEFKSVDQVKCQTDDEDGVDDDNSRSHRIDDDDAFFELNATAKREIVLHPFSDAYKSSTCPIGYLMTGYVTRREYDLSDPPSPVSATCHQLTRGRVDYDACSSILTEGRSGGNIHAYTGWNVECAFGHAAVGLKYDGYRVVSLRCCKLMSSFLDTAVVRTDTGTAGPVAPAPGSPAVVEPSRNESQQPSSVGKEVNTTTAALRPLDVGDYLKYVINQQDGATLDCNNMTETTARRLGFIVAIRSNGTSNFSSVDQIKCLADEDRDDPFISHELDDDDDMYFELNATANSVVTLDNGTDASNSSTCPPGYLLTGFVAPTSVQQPSLSVNCRQLTRGEVDYNVCSNMSTSQQQGGNYDPYRKWNVECAFGHAAVGVEFDGTRVTSLRCCELNPTFTSTPGNSVGGTASEISSASASLIESLLKHPDPSSPSSPAIGHAQQNVSDVELLLPADDRDDYRNYVVDEHDVAFTDGVKVEDLAVLELDCNKTTDARIRRPGYIVGIRAGSLIDLRSRDFSSVDQIKCQTLDEDEDDRNGHESVDLDDVYLELNSSAKIAMVLDPRNAAYNSSNCPKGYLLTGYVAPTGSKTAERPLPPVSANCVQLTQGKVDYSVCESLSTDRRDGGQGDPNLKWNVECPFGHAAVGVKFDGLRVRSLRCCKLKPATLPDLSPTVV